VRILFDGLHFGQAPNEFIVYWYGMLLMLGVYAGGWLASRRAARHGIDEDTVWSLVLWLTIGGIIGARLWHVFTPPPSSIEQGVTTLYYFTHPLDLINLRRGGLGIPGAVLGGAAALFFFLRRQEKQMSYALWADIAAPALALGQAIGRWGNYFNQELYGAPTDLPWKIFIEPGKRISGYQQFEYFHPLFLYESLWSLANMAFLLWLDRKMEGKLPRGSLFLVYLIVYPVGRFLLDFLRLDASQLGGLNANQTLMALVALSAAAALAWQVWRSRRSA